VKRVSTRTDGVAWRGKNTFYLVALPVPLTDPVPLSFLCLSIA
jgi:hypothetical protein